MYHRWKYTLADLFFVLRLLGLLRDIETSFAG
jgi:hypothetical protein